MSSPIDFLEVQSNVFSRQRMRAGLCGLRRAGLPIEWFERESLWRTTFTIWAHPVITSKLQELFGCAARRPARRLGHYLDVLS
jgi:hypothetical protein